MAAANDLNARLIIAPPKVDIEAERLWAASFTLTPENVDMLAAKILDISFEMLPSNVDIEDEIDSRINCGILSPASKEYGKT